MKVLVTGADGFIGSHLVEELWRRGYAVRAFVLYNSFNSWGWLEQAPEEVRREIEVVAGDVRDSHCVRDALRGCDVVLHLAALIAIPYSYRAPDSYLDTNIKGTLNILQAARELGTRRVIHTSTSEVYGSARFVPITEEHPLHAQSPYAASKIAADQLALSFHASFGMPVTVLRPFNTYGPRQSARAVIPTIIGQIAAGRKRLKLGALHPTRDFNYVADTVSGFASAIEAKGTDGEVINVGSGHETSVGELLAMIAELMGVEVETETESERLRPDASEVQRLCADNTLAKRLLGWKPRFAGPEGLREGLRQTMEWFTRPDNLERYKTDAFNV